LGKVAVCAYGPTVTCADQRETAEQELPPAPRRANGGNSTSLKGAWRSPTATRWWSKAGGEATDGSLRAMHPLEQGASKVWLKLMWPRFMVSLNVLRGRRAKVGDLFRPEKSPATYPGKPAIEIAGGQLAG
jgi:hypothetical protein